VETLRVIDETTGAVLAERAQHARSMWSQFLGLMGRKRLDEGAGLLLSPCSCVHTAFMRFPIDVVFLDREGIAVKVVSDLKPFRVAAARGARQALELPEGTARRGPAWRPTTGCTTPR
jgi:uncharacterized membrane protein (UPF0127 family)